MDESALARKFSEIQQENNFPGLMSECKLLLRKYKLNEHNIHESSKLSWKNKVKHAIVTLFKEYIVESMKSYKKVDHEKKKNEEFGLKSYLMNMNLDNGRMMFAIETEMVEKIKFNYMNNIQYENENWAYDYCTKQSGVYKPDTIQHVTICENYSNLRQDLNLDHERDAVVFSTNIFKFRNNLTK